MLSDSFKKLDDLMQKHGRKGVRLLFLFKLLKTKVKERIEQSYPTPIIEEETLNRLCVEKADQLLRLGRESPDEKDIKELLSKL